jgi:hypothetical protein
VLKARARLLENQVEGMLDTLFTVENLSMQKSGENNSVFMMYEDPNSPSPKLKQYLYVASNIFSHVCPYLSNDSYKVCNLRFSLQGLSLLQPSGM